MDKHELPPFFHDIFAPELPRHGPGSDECTDRALSFALEAMSRREGPCPKEMQVLDVGCGCGAQTIRLAGKINGGILAVDNHQPFLDELMRRARKAEVAGTIRTLLKDMRELGGADGTFDLVWSESALFVMGFQEGLAACGALLADGGVVAASEMAWFRPDAPEKCRRFFAEAYPALAGEEENLAMIRACGLKPVGHFRMPEAVWWDSYYDPLEKRLRKLNAVKDRDPEQLEMLAFVQKEIDIYRRYSDYYGYVFYLMRHS